MPRALVISNLHAPDCLGGYEMIASECMDALERNHGWQITCHCARTGRPPQPAALPCPATWPPRVRAVLTGYFPRGWSHHHALLPAAKHLANTPQITAALQRESAAADVTLLFNPRRLSTLQWLPAMAAARNPVAWVSDHWPSEYPDCDQLWRASQTHRLSPSPLVMLGAARVRKLYARSHPAPADLSCIRRAAFVSDYIMRKTARAFPRLEKAAVIPNGIDPALFPFAPMTPRRWQTWGFCGRIQPEKGPARALDLFARAAAANPDLRLLVAGDMATAHGAQLRKKIAAHPVLSRQVELLGLLPRGQLAEKFYHRAGVLLFTSQWDEPLALTILEAMSCGAYVAATPTGGTPEIVTEKTGLLLATTPETLAPLQTPHPTTGHLAQLSAARAAASAATVQNMAALLDDFTKT